MFEELGIHAGTFGDGRDHYEGIRVPSGTTVVVPRRTGFSFIDSQVEQASEHQGDTLVADRAPLLFEPRAEVRAWMINDALTKGVIPDESTAAAAITGMQGFLTAIAEHPDAILTPSTYVDEMWHRFTNWPVDYQQAGDEAYARIDHVPNGPDGSRPPGALNVQQTFQFLEESGYNPDPAAWPAGDAGGDCAGTPCTNGDCTSGGPPGDYPRFRALRIIRGLVEFG